jgi:hypothetical protein
MDIAEQYKYDTMFSTLSTEGWGILKDRLLEMYTQQNNVLSIPDEKIFWQQRGSLSMLHFMIEIEQVLQNEVIQINSQRGEEEEDNSDD